MATVRRNRTENATENRVRTDLANDLREPLRCPLLAGTEVKDVVLPAGGTVTIEHKLGREPSGVLVVRSRGGFARLYETARDTRTITFVSGAACTADLWVY